MTTSIMTNAATAGVLAHKGAHVSMFEARPSMLINKAAPTASKSTRTEKAAPLLVSVSFINILQTSFISYACCVGDVSTGVAVVL